jgi:hypothetical protein
MPLRIAIDVDGVLADMEGALRRLAVDSDGNEAAGSQKRTPAEQRRVWHRLRQIQDFWETLDELEPGTVSRLRHISRDRRWHVVFLTQRPKTAGDSVQLQTQRWLEVHGFACPSVLVVPGNRGKLASALHLSFVVDDVPEYCLDVQIESQAKPCLIWRKDEASLRPGVRRLGIEVFASFSSCLDYLEATDDARMARPKRPRLAERLKLRFGMGTPGSS